MKVPPALRWALIALAGLLIAVAVAVLASKLTSQRIGLSSEPLRAGQSLAPPEHRPQENDERGHSGDTQPSDTTATAPSQTTTTGTTSRASTTTADDSGTEIEGEGSGDDD